MAIVAERGAFVARGALVSDVMGPAGRVRLTAYLRSVYNGGVAVGAFIAGIGFAFDSSLAYRLTLHVAAVALVVGYGIYLLLPAGRPWQSPDRSDAERPGLFTDWPYLLVGLTSGLRVVSDAILTVGLPLWIVTGTDLPRPFAAWLLALNTVLVIVLQVYLSRGADTVDGAARLQLRGALTLFAGSVLVALSGVGSIPLAALALLAAVVLLTVGEIWTSNAAIGLRYGLAPEHAQGAYGGIFSIGTSVCLIVGPAAVTVATSNLRSFGWLVVGAIFLVMSLTGTTTIRLAKATRPLPEASRT